MAVLALLVPDPTSGAESIRAQLAPYLVSSRAAAQPTAPAPTIATSKGPSGAGPSLTFRAYLRHASTPDRSLRRGRARAFRSMEGRARDAPAALLLPRDPRRGRDGRPAASRPARHR